MSTPHAAAPPRNPTAPPTDVYRGGATIADWRPEDPAFWESTGRRVAYRNLACSMPALFLGFAVWMMWTTVVVKLPGVGFRFSDSQLFWLTALPGLSGATLRIFYSFLVPILGGRTFTVLSTASLLVPTIGAGIAVQDPATPYAVFVMLSLLAGLGGGNFASSMANISFFFPQSAKGTALGLNAGFGNLGVSAVQFLAGIVISTQVLRGESAAGASAGATGLSRGEAIHLENIAFLWVPLILGVCIAAWLFMNNLTTARASVREQRGALVRRDTWLMGLLHFGTFGSFIGYSAGLTMLIKTQFPGEDPLRYAFVGPLIGALIRPAGGWLADRIGGARVTLGVFFGLIAWALGILYFLAHKGDPGAFRGFLVMVFLLFATAGIGNGSTFRMIPVIFRHIHEKRAATSAGDATADSALAAAHRDALLEASTAIGLIAALAAYGAAVVPLTFGWSIKLTGAPFGAIHGFIAFYTACIATTWWRYGRTGAAVPC